MFTLIRPLAALALGLLGYVAGNAYRVLDDTLREDSTIALWMAFIAAVVGWRFLGGRLGQSLWMSLFVTVQAVVLAGIVASGLFALRQIFALGYQRRYREPMEAVSGFFENWGNYLLSTLDQDFLTLLAGGALIVGVVLHVLSWLMERRRNQR